MNKHPVLTNVLIVFFLAGIAHAQERRPLPPPVPDRPLEFDAAENVRFRVQAVTRGLSHPWALAFLADGDILVTERAGRVRIIRNGGLDPIPVATIDVATTFTLSGLMDIVLHPRFAENKFIYLTYNKPAPNMGRMVTLARGRWDGNKLVEVHELFVSDARIGASRLAFG